MVELPEGWTVVPAELPEVRILRLQPGDKLLVSCDKLLDHRDVEMIRQNFGASCPGYPVLVLEGSLRLDILREDGA